MMLPSFLISVALLGFLEFAHADVYMHNPRGSNDRNCERTVNRRNGNRLFDSQNNNNGGYACPRAVGDGEFQAENGDFSYKVVDPVTGSVKKYTQNKRVYYYSGSILPIEWTNQHGCGSNSKVSCEIVLQYACEDTLDPRVDDFWPWVSQKGQAGTEFRGRQHFRDYPGDNIAAPRDGVPQDSKDSATDTIPDNEASAIPNSVSTRRYGMQESYDHYQLCQRTQRNKGLYTADQKVRRNDRRGTRQNPNGNRNGLECPEERDYYPWWAPSPWIDIAVLSDAAKDEVCYSNSDITACSKRCQYYMNNTMNTNPKGYCDAPRPIPGSNITTVTPVSAKYNSRAWKTRQWYNNRDDCEAANFQWLEVKHSDNLNLPANNFVCAHTQFARANQLGNAGNADTIISQNQATGKVRDDIAQGVNANRFMWTVPDVPGVNSATHPDSTTYFSSMESAYKSCVLRIRYNISTSDFQQWPADAVVEDTPSMVSSKNNSRYEGDPRTPLMQDPYVYIGPGDGEDKGAQFVSLAINTNQYGRTFQDRSYVFSIKPLPTKNAAADNTADTPPVNFDAMKAALDAGGKIYNVNVRGKRGNIVQTFPSVEYDFVPNALSLSKNDMIHYQWTGSDYNPRRGCNNGEGGPPDANTFSTAANANLNSRADRSNVLFMRTMGDNVPKDMLGYEPDASLDYAAKRASAMEASLAHIPCYAEGDSDEVKAECYESTMRLGYLNQQRDSGSLTLRVGKACLTQKEIDDIAKKNRDIAENHPLNCAKMNAKPFPYFDGGVMLMRKEGWFPFYSSRNNNFSNREQIGVVCVGPNCQVTKDNVLQDTNDNMKFGGGSRQVPSTCTDTANGEAGANTNGATSCLGGSPSDPNAATTDILTVETLAIHEGDNDLKGDGNMYGCAVQNNYADTTTILEDVSDLTSEQQIGLAVGLIALGIAMTWGCWWVYKRYYPDSNDRKFQADASWLKRNQNRHAGVGNYFGVGGRNKTDWLHQTPPDEAHSELLNPSNTNVSSTSKPETQAPGNIQINKKAPRKKGLEQNIPTGVPAPPPRAQRPKVDRSSFL